MSLEAVSPSPASPKQSRMAACPVYRYAPSRGPRGCHGPEGVPGIRARPAGDRRDRAVDVDAPDAMVERVRDEHAAESVGRDAVRRVELREDRGSAIAAVALRAGAGERRDRAVELDAPDALVAGVGDEHAAEPVDRDGVRRCELRAGRRAAVAGEAGIAGAGDGRDAAVELDAHDAMVVEIGD